MRAIVLGSGLNEFSKYFEQSKIKSFESVLDVPFETLDGHERKFIWCTHETEEFVIISGKFHYYEGHSYAQLVSPLKYAVEELGVDNILVTSASGGLSNKIEVGEWAYLRQIVCIPEVSSDFQNYRNLSEVRDDELIGDDYFASFPQVTYAYHQGPSLGSVAEYKMLNQLGADLVGMSMLPEYCYLKSLDIESHFLSLPVCNYYPFQNVEEPSFEEVLKISAEAVPILVDIFKLILSNQNLE